jgi:hypothetical protein
MYEPIRTKSVHSSMADAGVPHRTRAEELDIRLAGHLTALLTVTDELRALVPDHGLDDLAHRIAAQVTRLREGRAPLRADPSTPSTDSSRVEALRQRARTLAGHALVIADSRADEEVSGLASDCLEAHARPSAAGLALS